MLLGKAVLFISFTSRFVNGVRCTYQDDNPICIAALEDKRNAFQTFNTSHFAPIVVGLSGGISALSSGLIIAYIIRSEIGLSSMYHRIMFAISCGDVLSSIAMATSTLFMPQDMIYKQFEGLSIGNEFTCNVQGFLVWFGRTISILYSAGLAMYYLLIIKYKVKESTMRKCFEPVLHSFIILLAAEPPIIMWITDRFNPTPLQSFCTAVAYPWYCKLNQQDPPPEECMLRGSTSVFAKWARVFHIFIYYGMLFGTLLTFLIAMPCIVSYVHRQQSYLNDYIDTVHGNRLDRIVDQMAQNRLRQARQRNIDSKNVLRVAMAYILSCILTQVVILFHTGENNLQETLETSSLRWTFQFLMSLLLPLQGLFNALIFFSQKIYNIRHKDDSRNIMTIREAIKKLVVQREQHGFEISNMSLIRVRGDERNTNRYAFDGDGVSHDEEEKFDDENEQRRERSVNQENTVQDSGVSVDSQTQENSKIPSIETPSSNISYSVSRVVSSLGSLLSNN